MTRKLIDSSVIFAGRFDLIPWTGEVLGQGLRMFEGLLNSSRPRIPDEKDLWIGEFLHRLAVE